MKDWIALLVLTLLCIEQTLSITCQKCKRGMSFNDCMKKALNYDCTRIGNTFSHCKVECNDRGVWKFGCATPSQCSIQKRNCENSRDCGITCCKGSLCLRNVTHTWCSEGFSTQASTIAIGTCAIIALYVR